MDSGYGTNTALRDGITALELNYVAGIMPNTSVRTEGKKPLRRKAWSGRGRPPTRLRRSARHRPVQVKQLALSLAAKAWRPIKWREGSADWLASRFARLRVRPGGKCPKLCVPAARGLPACGVSALTPQADRRTVSQTGSARQSIRGSIASTPS